MANSFVHLELTTPDLGTAKNFYKKLFDWKLSDTPMPGGTNYTMIDVGQGVGGGMQAKPMPNAPTTWLPYVQVDDVKKTIEKARKNGATVILDYQEVMNMGALGIFVDPTGAMLGLWQPFAMPQAKTAASKSAAPKKRAAAKKPATATKPAAAKKSAASRKTAAPKPRRR